MVLSPRHVSFQSGSDLARPIASAAAEGESCVPIRVPARTHGTPSSASVSARTRKALFTANPFLGRRPPGTRGAHTTKGGSVLRRTSVLLAAIAATLAIVGTASSTPGGRAAATGVVFVTSQALYYDTFVTRDPIPMQGPFQLLVNGTTEFGPGDPGYLGGRWWEDTNPNGVQDAE